MLSTTAAVAEYPMLEKQVLRRSGISYAAYCIGPDPETWSFRLGDSTFRQRLGKVLHDLGVTHAYAPKCSLMNARILRTRFKLSNRRALENIILHSNPSEPAEGLSLQPGNAFIMDSAGCGLIVAEGGGHLLAAHAGTASLVDFGRVENLRKNSNGTVYGKRTRRHESVVHAIAAWFIHNDIPLAKVRIQTFFYYDPLHYAFNRKEYVDFNEKLYLDVHERLGPGILKPEGQLNLGLLATRIANKLGFGQAGHDAPLRVGCGFALTRDDSIPNRRNLTVLVRDA